VFLALGMGLAEVLDAGHLFIGVNAVDYSGYPDCRPEFIDAFEALASGGDTPCRGGRAAPRCMRR
jgi:7-cyano-7-deazaguanine synthase